MQKVEKQRFFRIYLLTLVLIYGNIEKVEWVIGIVSISLILLL